MPKILKVLTYNIHKGFSVAHFRFVLHQIREEIQTINADVVFLQEIQGEHSRHKERIEEWPDAPQIEFLAEEIWPHHAYGKNAIYRKGHHGNAILSKYPFVDWENIDVSKHKRASRSLLHGVIVMPDSGERVHVICIHLALFKQEREKQLHRLCERIESHIPHDEPLIIAGDFNDWQGRAERHLEKNLAMQEVFKTLRGHHARTFPAWGPTLPVDRIYFRKLNLELCHQLRSMPWRKLSDHTPLYAEFSLQ